MTGDHREHFLRQQLVTHVQSRPDGVRVHGDGRGVEVDVGVERGVVQAGHSGVEDVLVSLRAQRGADCDHFRNGENTRSG